jgi:hypothetical protein
MRTTPPAVPLPSKRIFARCGEAFTGVTSAGVCSLPGLGSDSGSGAAFEPMQPMMLPVSRTTAAGDLVREARKAINHSWRFVPEKTRNQTCSTNTAPRNSQSHERDL